MLVTYSDKQTNKYNNSRNAYPILIMLAIHAVMCVPFVHIVFREISKNDCHTRMILRQIFHIIINLIFLLKFLIFQTFKYKNFENKAF